jgi:P27 family predicted phage terminase small subunit
MPTTRTKVQRLPRRGPAPWEIHNATPTPEPKPPRCPSHLSKEARTWWKRLCAKYDLTAEPAQLLLATALEAFMRMRDAQAAISRDGLVLKDADGKVKNHPAATVERDARSQFVQTMKALNLAAEVEPIRSTPGRPAGSLTGPSRFFND